MLKYFSIILVKIFIIIFELAKEPIRLVFRFFSQNITAESIHQTYFEARQIETEIFESFGYEINKDIIIEDVSISKDNWIHTIKGGGLNENNAKPIIVLLHGYMASSIVFYELIKRLNKKFNVYCLDVLGMGLSSHPSFNCKGQEEAISFFTNSLEKWRQKLNIEKFIIAGHSFGGYLAANYTTEFPQYVEKLVLISSAGVTKYTKEENLANFEKILKHMKCTSRLYFKFMKVLWKNKLVPTYFYERNYFPGELLLKSYIKKRFELYDKPILRLWIRFFDLILQLPVSAEKAIHEMFFFPNVCPILSIEECEKDIQCPIYFFYGEKDWMDKTGAYRIQKNRPTHTFIEIIHESGHHINIDNPQDLADSLLNIVLDTNLHI